MTTYLEILDKVKTEIWDKYSNNSSTNTISWKISAKVATTANITLSGIQTIDGITLTIGDRVLVKNQTPSAKNGVYIVASETWTRATDMNSTSEINDSAVYVEKGDTQADTGWTQTSVVSTLEASEIVFEQFGGSASLASAFNYYYNFYSWLLSNSNIYSTYDSPLTFSNELAKLTQQIVENYNNKSLLTAQNVILTNQNTILTDHGEKLGDIRDDIRVLKGRGESEHLGIVTRHIYMADIHDKHRSALLRMALKDSNMLDDFNRACAEEEVSPIFK